MAVTTANFGGREIEMQNGADGTQSEDVAKLRQLRYHFDQPMLHQGCCLGRGMSGEVPKG